MPKKSDWTAISSSAESAAADPDPAQRQVAGRRAGAASDRNVAKQHAPAQHQRADAAGHQHAHRRPHHQQQDVHAAAVGREQALRHQPRRHQHPGDDAADQHAGADAQADDDAGADAEERDAEAEPDARGEALTTSGIASRDPLQRPSPGTRGPTRRARPIIANADLRACGPRASSTISVSPAAMPSANGSFSSIDEVLAQRHGEEHAEQPRRREPRPGLHRLRLTSKPLPGSSGEHVERRQQPAQEGDLPRRRARRLDDVVLPAVVALREEAERQEAEERRHDRDVRTEAELQDHVGIRRAHDQRDHQADDDRARRELADVGRLLRAVRRHAADCMRGPPNQRDLFGSSARRCRVRRSIRRATAASSPESRRPRLAGCAATDDVASRKPSTTAGARTLAAHGHRVAEALRRRLDRLHDGALRPRPSRSAGRRPAPAPPARCRPTCGSPWP